MKHFSQKRTTVFYTDEVDTVIVRDFDTVTLAKAFFANLPSKFDCADLRTNTEMLTDFRSYLFEFLNDYVPKEVEFFRDIPARKNENGGIIDAARREWYRGDLENLDDTFATVKVRIKGMSKKDIERTNRTANCTLDGKTLLIHRETNYVVVVGTAVDVKWFAQEYVKSNWKHEGKGLFVCGKYRIQSRNAIGFTHQEAESNRKALLDLLKEGKRGE